MTVPVPPVEVEVSAQVLEWTAWHTVALAVVFTDVGVATGLFVLHYAVGTILYLLGAVQAIAVAAVGALYQLTSKKAS